MDSLRLYVQEVNLFMRDNLVAMAATALLDCFGKAYIAFVFCADTTLGACAIFWNAGGGKQSNPL